MKIPYMVSPGVAALANKEELDLMVQGAIQRWDERGTKLADNSVFCCRMMLKSSIDDIILFVMLPDENGELSRHLLLWSEAEASGAAKQLMGMMDNKSHRRGPGYRLLPEELQM